VLSAGMVHDRMLTSASSAVSAGVPPAERTVCGWSRWTLASLQI
jgi:hypothetical protein